jgi:hypothetical protein
LSRKGCPRGWALTEQRGFAGLNITAKAGGGKRRQIQLPISWRFDNAKKLGAAVCKIYAGFSSGIEPELAANKITIDLQANQMPELLTPRSQIQNWAGRVNQAGRPANKGEWRPTSLLFTITVS